MPKMYPALTSIRFTRSHLESIYISRTGLKTPYANIDTKHNMFKSIIHAMSIKYVAWKGAYTCKTLHPEIENIYLEPLKLIP